MKKLGLLITAIAALTVLAVLPSAAQAVSGSFVATGGIPLKLQGESTIKARSSIVVVEGHLLPTLDIRGSAIHLEHVRVTSAYAPVAAGVDMAGERRVETNLIEVDGKRLSLQSRQADLVLAAKGRDATLTSPPLDVAAPREEIWTNANAQVSALLIGERYAPPVPNVRLAQNQDPRNDEIVLAAATYEATVRDGVASLTHLEYVLFYGGVLRDETGDLYESKLTRVDRPGAVYANGAWTGPGSHIEETVDYYVIRAAQGTARVGGPSVSLFSEDLFILHDGRLGLPWAEGRIETQNESIALQGDQVVLEGSLRLRPVGVAVEKVPQLTFLGDGEIKSIVVGVRAATSATTQAMVVAGTSAASLGALAAIVYYWPVIKYGLSLALFPLYARVRKEETLEHKGREVLYELIKNEPGISTNQLAKNVTFGWSTLTYHLRVLERNEAIVSVRDGRYKRFFDRTTGRYSNGRKFVLAVLKNDSTFDIARFIRDRPGSSQKEVAGSFNLSPSSVHWHVERLTEVGLVSKVREAHNVKYFPGEGWQQITVEDLKALAEPAGGASPEVVATPASAVNPSTTQA